MAVVLSSQWQRTESSPQHSWLYSRFACYVAVMFSSALCL